MRHAKRGNPHRCKRRRKPCFIRPVAVLPKLSAQPCESRPRASAQPAGVPPTGPIRLTLHDDDPITSNEDTLYTLFYEDYRGYTIYSTEQGRCCIHGKHGGCLRLRGKFVGFPDIEEAKTLIKRFRAKGYTSYDSVERYLPEWEFVCLNGHEQQRTLTSSRPMQRVYA